MFLLIFGFASATAPTLNSVSESSDPLTAGSAITFTATAAASIEGFNFTLYICKDGSTTSCTKWCSDPDLNSNATASECSYTTNSSDAGTKDYNAFICDTNSECSNVVAGQFTVNAAADTTPPNATVKDLNGDTSAPYWARTDQNVILTINAGESGAECKYSNTNWGATAYSGTGTLCTNPSGNDWVCDLGAKSQTTGTDHNAFFNCKDSSVNATGGIAVNYGVDYNAPTATIASVTASGSNATMNYSGSDAQSGVQKYEVKVDSGSYVDKGTATSHEFTGLSAGDHNFTLRVVDNAGNSATVSATQNVPGGSDLSTPSIGSSSHPNEDKWYGSNDIDLNWASVSGATYQYALDGNSVRTPDSNNETTSTTKAYSNLADGTYYFHLRACNGSGCGGTDHFRIRIDTTAPAPAGSLSGFGQSNGSIYLTWGAPTDASGIREYTIYRNIFQKVNNRDFVPSDSGVKKFTGITGTSYTDRNGLESGIAYYYRLQATDNAGNEGSMTAVYKVLNSGTSCSLELGSGIPEFLRGESLNATITVSGGSIKNAALRSKFPGTGLKNEQAGLQGTTINVSLQVPQDESGNGYIEIDGKDAAGNACKKQFGFKVDFEKPAVEITSPSADALVSGTIAFTVNAEDAVSGIAEVAFYADGKALAAPQKNGAVYTLQWNSESVEAGKHALMAKAKDGAGNEKTAQVEVRTEGTGSFTTKEYSYDSGKIRGLLKSAAVKDSLVASAEKLINENKPRRKLEITKSGGKYTATITVTLKNTGSAKGLQVIEVIPKSVASSARDITSEQEFTVIQNDPIIKFDLGEVAYNGEKSIAYVAGKGLTEAQARQVSAGFGSFAAPPIVLEGDVANPIEITNTNDLIFWGFIVLIGLFILLIIFVVLGGGAFLLHRHLKTRESFAAPPSLKPEIRPKRLPQENEPMRKRKWASK